MKRDEQRWAAVQSRDATADGDFVYGVVSTGVFCHPSCPSRSARRDNMRFFASSGEARDAGFRACRRCLPENGTPAARRLSLIERACHLLDVEESYTVARLANALGVGKQSLSRDFREITGLTPKQWQLARRREQLVERTMSAGRVSDAVFDAGYESATRFYADAQDRLGMTPSGLRAGGVDEQIRYALANSPLGRLLVAWTDIGLCAVELSLEPDECEPDVALESRLNDRFFRAELVRDDRAGAALVQDVVARVDEPLQAEKLSLDVRGTAFQQRVWTALCRIPVGVTASYSDVAELIGSPTSSRAVATACAANPLALVVPCHRVVRADGSLSGYRWGETRKAALLRSERDKADVAAQDSSSDN